MQFAIAICIYVDLSDSFMKTNTRRVMHIYYLLVTFQIFLSLRISYWVKHLKILIFSVWHDA